MAVDQAQQWLPDPAGKHQFRLHSDGKPTEWVSDDGSMTIDRLDSVAPAPPADPAGPAVASVQPGSNGWGSASNSQPATPAAPATPPVRPAGWYRNASNPSEVRYWDGSDWAVDQTVATSTPSSQPSAPSPAAPVGSLADTGSLAPVTPGETESRSSFDATPSGESLAPEAASGLDGLDTPGRHSAGRTLTGDTAGLPSDTPTVSSVWAQPDVPGDRTPAPTPPTVVTQLAPAAPVATAPAAPAAPAPVAAAHAAPPPTPVVTPPAEGAAPDPTATIPADWYPDPSDRTRLRYWDGAGWTVNVLDEAPTPRH